MTKRREKKATKPLLAAVVSDLHFPFIHRPTWKAFKQWHAHVKPDITVMAGDLIDFPQLSRYPQGVGQAQGVLDDIKSFVWEANALAKECGKLVLVEGNHDDRWRQKFIEPLALHMPGLKGFTLREQCLAQGLNPMHEWIIESHETPGFFFGDVLIHHGHRRGSKFGSTNLARSALTRTLGRSQVHGHSHRVELVALGTHRGTCVAVANGHMSEDHDYSLENQWTRGFTILEQARPGGFVHPYPVVVEHGSFVWNGSVFGMATKTERG